MFSFRGVELSTPDILYRFLKFGFYPRELPPVFKTSGYADFADLKSSIFIQFEDFKSEVVSFDGTTFHGKYRVFGVIHPLSFFLLSNDISTNWNEIQDFLDSSKASTAGIKIPTSRDKRDRAFTTSSFSAKDDALDNLYSAFPLLLSLDINRFYGSVYTHSVPWAVLGKEEAQKRHALKTLDSHWSAKIDRRLRASNWNQTIGIPIGPDTSRIIAELILTRINMQLTEHGAVEEDHFLHSIDDYRFGAIDSNVAQKISTAFEQVIRDFHLRTREDKWALCSTAECQHPWKIRLASYENFDDPLFIEAIFAEVFSSLNSKSGDNVLGFATSKYRKIFNDPNNQTKVLGHFQRTLFSFPWTVRFIAPTYIRIFNKSASDKVLIRLFEHGLSESCRKHDTLSVLWYLYLALYYDLEISEQMFSQCYYLDCPLVDLMLAHAIQNALAPVGNTSLNSRHKEKNLNTSAWIYLYETEVRGWQTAVAGKIDAKGEEAASFFRMCRTKGVRFYDVEGLHEYDLRDDKNNSPSTSEIDNPQTIQKKSVEKITSYMIEYLDFAKDEVEDNDDSIDYSDEPSYYE